MTSLAALIRAILCGSDRTHALAQEANLLVGERTRANSLLDSLAVEFHSQDGAGATLGTAVDGGWPVRVARERLAGHAGLWGPSGSGKSYLPTGPSADRKAEVLRAVLLKGAGLFDIWWRLLVLLGFGVALLAIASSRFRKRVA